MKALSITLCRRASLTLVMALAAFTCSCASFSLPRDAESSGGCDDCKTCAKVCKDPTMHALACDLDHLEDHIEKYGSVVIKEPDVWGQARLTQYREEFEREMYKDIGAFSPSLQGSIVREDQAFFANATALSAAISSTGAVTTYPAGTTLVANGSATPQTTPVVITPTPINSPPAVGTADSKGVAPANPADIFSQQAFASPLRNSTTQAVFFPGTPGTTGSPQQVPISLEPTIVEEQKARFLNALNQIRRTNEGDDTADSPGYSLNLVRVPVSVLPGKETRKGHAAEVTMTLTPVLGDDLLPVTFRNLVLNDLAEQIGVPLTEFLNDKKDSGRYLTECMHRIIQKVVAQNAGRQDAAFQLTQAELGFLEGMRDGCEKQEPLPDLCAPMPLATPADNLVPGNKAEYAPNNRAKYQLAQMADALKQTRFVCKPPTVSNSKRRNAGLPFPPSEIIDVYGLDFVFHIAYSAKQTFQNDPANNKFAHLPDVQGYLREELAAAYNFLAEPTNVDLWTTYGGQGLAALVHARKLDELEKQQADFACEVYRRSGEQTRVEHSTTGALAWAILVESALLNEHLVQDMKETASAKGCALCGDWKPYYLPVPPPEARQSFNDYVRCRWPIHVFALDPVTQDQNLADSDATRREMQLALSLAFVSGKISASNMTRYARRIDAQYDTIDLNRTAVGFSHGEDTFGWRFYPRFQTPDTETNATVLVRDMLIGGPNKDALLRDRRLEPGIRDCVAIVMMPSFVPYMTCDTVSDWINVTDPKCKKMDSKDALQLSRKIKAIQTCQCKVNDADCYRDGELGRLMRKADQLAARLPLQTLAVQVPYENTLGGFQMFSTGVTDLAPELLGWYGAPYINLAADTTLFLVGNHFSVKQTRVIAGGVAIDPRQRPDLQEMMSRQVLRITIPRGAQTIKQGKDLFVDVHIGTPYGVTQHLLIPAGVNSIPPAQSGYAWSPLRTVAATITVDAKGVIQDAPLTPSSLTLVDGSATPDPSALKSAKLAVSVEILNAAGQYDNLGLAPLADAVFTNRSATVDLTPITTLLKTVTDPRLINAPGTATLHIAGMLTIGSGDSAVPVPLDNVVQIDVKIQKAKP